MDISLIPLGRGVRVLREYGVRPFGYQLMKYSGVWDPLWNTITSRRPFGTNIFSRDWDLLVILDSCRVDAVDSVYHSLDTVETGEAIRSVGSMSAEWMLNTFTEEYRTEISDTVLLSGNIWSHRIFNESFHDRRSHKYDMIHKGLPRWYPIDAQTFKHYETVYPHANQDHRLHPESEHIPHVLTDRAIDIGRELQFERMVVHYTLPHLNHIAGALDWNSNGIDQEDLMVGPGVLRSLNPEEKSYEPARKGEVSRETIHENHLRNIEFVMEYVNVLRKNIAAEKVVITADHGESFGENNVWGHPYGCPFSTVKSVPWVSTTATDERTYDSRFEPLNRTPTEQELMDFLKNMGYYA